MIVLFNVFLFSSSLLNLVIISNLKIKIILANIQIKIKKLIKV